MTSILRLGDIHPAIDGKPTPQLWSAELASAASITPKPISWLWPQWLAKGKLTVLAGAGGSGKTTLAIGLISCLTRGEYWPDGSRCNECGNTLI